MAESTTTTTASERAYAFTKDLIMRGELPGGALVSEGQICAMLGLSRTPVHEAFLRLGNERLVELNSRRGAVVVPISPNESENVLEVREPLEASAAARVIRRGGPAEALTSVLRTVLDEQEKAVAIGDIPAFVASDDVFHSAVVAASGNSLAIHCFDLLRDRQWRMSHQRLTVGPDVIRDAFGDHCALAEALIVRDADGYAAALRTHLQRYSGGL